MDSFDFPKTSKLRYEVLTLQLLMINDPIQIALAPERIMIFTNETMMRYKKKSKIQSEKSIKRKADIMSFTCGTNYLLLFINKDFINPSFKRQVNYDSVYIVLSFEGNIM